MERYEAYKDSGVKWLGEIPVTWTCGRIRSVYALRKELVEDGEPDELVSVSEYYGVDYRRNRISSSDVLVRADSLEGYQLCYPDDLVMNIMLAWKGAQGTSAIKGLVSPSYGVFRPLEGSCPRYYHYLMRTDQYKEYFKSYSSGIIDSRLRLYPEVFLHLNCHVPPLEEQRAIADYLDAKTAEIDALVVDCEREVGLLQEYRKAVISEAVTKGLEPTAPMKDSGVEWIGEIPEGWGLPKLGSLTIKIGSGKTPRGGADVYVEEGVPFLRSQNVYDTGLVLDNVVYLNDEIDEEMASTRVMHSDVLLNITGGSIGRCCVYELDTHANVNQHVCIIRLSSLALPKFIQFYWNSSLGSTTIDMYQTGANREGMNFEQIASARIPLPPINEQHRIAGYLDAKSAEIDSLIEVKQQMADKLREYRRSLISEAVTGKFKVPGV